MEQWWKQQCQSPELMRNAVKRNTEQKNRRIQRQGISEEMPSGQKETKTATAMSWTKPEA